MSLSSEMEKNSTEDDCADSGAETGGSPTDCSPMSSASSDIFMGDLQDPFLVSVHIIADPGHARLLQQAADQVLSWVHPDLTLFRVSERAAGQLRRPKQQAQPAQPSLAVIIFLQEDHGDEESIERLHWTLKRPPWRYHHTEQVNGRGMLPLSPACQDFFTLAPGTPLWALRQVHYGKEIIRLTVYCRHESYADTVRLYRLLLQRRLAQRKEDFCFCVVYSNPDTEIQLSFKRLPWGQKPTPLECAVMEIRVRDVGGLVPLLPHPCTPISAIRWQTEDYDGNKILLQVRGSWHHRRHTIARFSQVPPECDPVSSEQAHHQPRYGRGPPSYRNRRYHRNSVRPQHHPPVHARASQCSLPLVCEQETHHTERRRRDPEMFWAGWTGHRTRSLFSLPTQGGPDSTCPSPSSSLPRCASSFAAPIFRLNVEALVGAEETDVDTGQRVCGSSVDLSVTSAYVHSHLDTDQRLPLTRPLSAPPQNRGPTPSALSTNQAPSWQGQHSVPSRTGSDSTTTPPKSILCLSRQQSPAVRVLEGEQQLSNGTTTVNLVGSEEEEELEFYI